MTENRQAQADDTAGREIQNLIDGFPWHGDLEGKTFTQAVADEMHDYEMIIRHCTEVYGLASGYRISKAETLPSEVEAIFNEIRSQEINEAFEEGKQAALDAQPDRQLLEDVLEACDLAVSEWDALVDGHITLRRFVRTITPLLPRLRAAVGKE